MQCRGAPRPFRVLRGRRHRKCARSGSILVRRPPSRVSQLAVVCLRFEPICSRKWLIRNERDWLDTAAVAPHPARGRASRASAAPAAEPARATTTEDLGPTARTVRVGDATLHEGDLITVDGDEGAFHAGAAELAVEYPEEHLTRLEALRQRKRRAWRLVLDAVCLWPHSVALARSGVVRGRVLAWPPASRVAPGSAPGNSPVLDRPALVAAPQTARPARGAALHRPLLRRGCHGLVMPRNHPLPKPPSLKRL
jgi:hypothetical protein